MEESRTACCSGRVTPRLLRGQYQMVRGRTARVSAVEVFHRDVVLVEADVKGYHHSMIPARTPFVETAHAVLCASLPWVAIVDGRWVPAVVVLVIPLHRFATRSSWGEPLRSCAVAASALLAVGADAGWGVALGWLLLIAGVGGAVVGLKGLQKAGRPDALDLVIVVGWACVMCLAPDLAGSPQWGWAMPLLALLTSRRAFYLWFRPAPSRMVRLGPPTREVRGTLSISGSIPGEDGLPRTRPLEFEVLAGSTLAVLGDDDVVIDLAEVATGRRAPLDGQVCVDGVPHEPDQSPIAVISAGEPFIAGSFEDNLAVLRGQPLDAGTNAAVREACSLDVVERALGAGTMAADGEPLDRFHRLLVQAGRVLSSHYRVVVVIDPMPWVNPVRAEIWRQAVVRASVGRTALWITGDRKLASRADRIVELRYGTLQPVEDFGR